jgi:hypothetical protein
MKDPLQSPSARQACADLKLGAIDFLNELVGQFPEETDLIWARIWVETQIDAARLMDRVVERVLPHRDAILRADEAFFLGNAAALIGEKRADRLIVLWNGLAEDDRRIAWAWVQSFVAIAERFCAAAGR